MRTTISVIRSCNVYACSNRHALARILQLLLLCKIVLDLPISEVDTTHLKGLISLETELILRLNVLLADVVRTVSTFTTPKKFMHFLVVKSKNVGAEFMNMGHYER